jgi:hypothetical protein
MTCAVIQTLALVEGADVVVPKAVAFIAEYFKNEKY